MKKKSVLLLIAIAISVYGRSQASWQIESSPVIEDLVSVCFIDSQNGWILSQQGTLLKTTNAGQSWQTSELGEGTFTSVYFNNQDHGCIVGYQDSSFILITTNGGDSWSEKDHKKANLLNDVFFINDSKGWTVGIRNNLNYSLYTADGGENWSEQMNIFVQEGELFSISFRDENQGNTCGAQGIFLTTNSGGSSWALNISIPQLGVDINSLYNWGILTGCAVGSDGTALYTTNNWAHYVETNTNTDLDLYAVSGDPATGKLWAVGESGIIKYTPSYLLGWTTQTSGVTVTLKDIDMIDENNGWAVGGDGTILHYSLGTSVDEESFQTFTIYPNPANNVFNIQSDIEGCEVQIVIIDITGKTLKTIHLTTGNENTTVDVSDISSGIYFLKISTQEDMFIEKLHIQ